MTLVIMATFQMTPVSHDITTHSQKVDENVDPAKFGRLCSASPHLGFGVPCWCGWGGWHLPLGSALLVSGFILFIYLITHMTIQQDTVYNS